MNGRMKALSAALAVVAVIGLVASGMTVNDVLGAKSYWEQKSIESDENLAKLEDGLNQLQDNEQAYLDGRKELADGKAEYAEGQQTLEQGYADYAQGQQDYEDGKKEYADGKKLLDSKTQAFNEGKAQKVQAKQVFDVVNMMVAGVTNEQAIGILANLTNMDVASVKKGYDNGNDATVANNRKLLASAKIAYEQYNLLTQVAMEENVAISTGAAVASNLKEGIQESDIASLYSTAKRLINQNGSADNAAAILEFITAGTTDAISTGNALALYNPVQSILSMTDLAIYDSIRGAHDASLVEKAIAAINTKISEGTEESTAILEVSSDTAYSLLSSDISNIYNAYKTLNKARGSYTDAIAYLVNKDSSLNSDILTKVYQSMSAILNCKGSLDNTAALIDSKRTDVNANEVKLIYSLIQGYQKKMSEAEAKGLLSSIITAMGISLPVDDALAAGSPQGQIAQGALIDSAEKAYRTVNAMVAAKGSLPTALQTMASMAGKDVPSIEYAYKMGSPNGQAAIQAQLDEYTNGQAKLRAAKVELDAAPGKLADAEKQLAEGEAKLADAAKQIAEGEEKLAEFEDGAAEAKDGIQQVVDTEPDGWLASIASRLPEDFGYEKENGDLEIAKGFEAIAAARDYKKDSGAAIETELYGRIYGIVAVAIASILALIAAVLGFTKKYKGAIPCAALAAVAGGVATFLTGKAGTVFSVLAGSTLGSLGLAAGIALAVVALVHAVASGSAAKAN